MDGRAFSVDWLTAFRFQGGKNVGACASSGLCGAAFHHPCGQMCFVFLGTRTASSTLLLLLKPMEGMVILGPVRICCICRLSHVLAEQNFLSPDVTGPSNLSAIGSDDMLVFDSNSRAHRNALPVISIATGG